MANDFVQLPDLEVNVLASTLINRVKDYFQDESHRTSFEEWYEKKYGKPYVWND